MNSLPSEIVHCIFEYLPVQDLVRVGATCKKFYEIAQNETLPERLKIPKLSPEIIQKNALLLWNYSEGNFSVDNKGALVHIRPYHLFARFFKWLDYDNVTQKVNKAVEITFQEIYRLNQQGYLPLPKNKKPSEPKSSICSAPLRLYVWNPNWFYSYYYPADYLAERILNSKQFTHSKIHKAAQLVQEQASLYNKNCDKYGSTGLIMEWGKKPFKDERVLWFDCGIDEAFFDKSFK